MFQKADVLVAENTVPGVEYACLRQGGKRFRVVFKRDASPDHIDEVADAVGIPACLGELSGTTENLACVEWRGSSLKGENKDEEEDEVDVVA